MLICTNFEVLFLEIILRWDVFEENFPENSYKIIKDLNFPDCGFEHEIYNEKDSKPFLLPSIFFKDDIA